MSPGSDGYTNCQTRQKERTQMQIGNSNDRFYFQVCISSDRMINKLARKNFRSRGQDNKKHRMNKKRSHRRKEEQYSEFKTKVMKI